MNFDSEDIILLVNKVGVASSVFFSLVLGIGGLAIDAPLKDCIILFIFGLVGGYMAAWILLLSIAAIIILASLVIGKILGYLIFLSVLAGAYLLYIVFNFFI